MQCLKVNEVITKDDVLDWAKRDEDEDRDDPNSIPAIIGDENRKKHLADMQKYLEVLKNPPTEVQKSQSSSSSDTDSSEEEKKKSDKSSDDSSSSSSD